MKQKTERGTQQYRVYYYNTKINLQLERVLRQISCQPSMSSSEYLSVTKKPAPQVTGNAVGQQANYHLFLWENKCSCLKKGTRLVFTGDMKALHAGSTTWICTNIKTCKVDSSSELTPHVHRRWPWCFHPCGWDSSPGSPHTFSGSLSVVQSTALSHPLLHDPGICLGVFSEHLGNSRAWQQLCAAEICWCSSGWGVFKLPRL